MLIALRSKKLRDVFMITGRATDNIIKAQRFVYAEVYGN